MAQQINIEKKMVRFQRKALKKVSVFRRCLDCGYERFKSEAVYLLENGGYESQGFIDCPRCRKDQFALFGYRDRRRTTN